MPVYKRAMRPSAAASNRPRDPELSDNDFTVLLKREAPPIRRIPSGPPPAPTSFPRAVTRQIAPPGPAPKPPIFERPVAWGRPTVAALERIETVTIAPRLRERVLRIVVLMSLGCAVGIGVELFLRSGVAGNWSMRPEPSVVSLAPLMIAPEPEQPLQPAIAEPVAEVLEKDAAAPVHHHHAHHGAAALAGSAVPTTSAPGEAAAPPEGDDFAAAVQTLSKAKEEVTLP